MSKRTVLNETYKGLVESFSIPADLHEREGRKYATFGSVVPIHCCSPEEVEQRSKTTHHYCDIFTEQILADPDELVYVRLDENLAEKVFINRTKRILMVSSDGVLAQWRCAPTFESTNKFVAGAPIVNKQGELVSVVTVKRGNHYAVSSFEGDGGYFTSDQSWRTIHVAAGASVYGDKQFSSREQLRQHVAALADAPPPPGPAPAPAPLLLVGAVPRVALLAAGGAQLAHVFLRGAHANDIEYL